MQSRRFALSVLGITVPALALGIGLAVPAPAVKAQSQGAVVETPLPDQPPAATAAPAAAAPTTNAPTPLVPQQTTPTQTAPAQTPQQAAPAASTAAAPGAANPSQTDDNTYDQESVLTAASDALGQGAEKVGEVIEKIFAEQGRPNAYIVGQEGGGAFIVGVRYGNGTLYHKVEGQMPVHWTGPSIGPDVGGDASKSFTLIYNLYDTNDLFRRYPAIEGKVYVIGGFTVSYHQRDNVIIVPVRLGAGWRLGANMGYINYTKERRYLPF
ncbi:DUF1134 domain-containing protein [Pedomonas mirosovicensis]|uniref:DUF1134 domain-containing protein n=1 Tax=Pedomonas mirosovicensis TaxID=2908641 RepID=UPI00216A2B4D|nr:DUF1134 domain-containing protein [Pedomonas mirosovicensis]MCH8685589.1 DUF1134 domain-containing protein [Pedomonas mirosovicensis]